MSEVKRGSDDCPHCPHCKTPNLVITYRAGYRACWECGGELADNFPSEEDWTFAPHPYGWRRRNQTKEVK